MAKFDVPKIKYNLTPEEKAIQELIAMKYRSPIEIISQDVQTKFEDLVMNTIYSYEIKVDKDELIKALQYDRDQYIQGFMDACGGVTFTKIKSILAREIFEEIDGITDLVAKGLIGELEFYDKIAELKKTYTESEDKT